MAQRDDKPVSAGNPHAVKKLRLWCHRSRDSKVRSGCEAHRGKDIFESWIFVAFIKSTSRRSVPMMHQPVIYNPLSIAVDVFFLFHINPRKSVFKQNIESVGSIQLS